MIHVPTNTRPVPIPTKPRGTTPPVTPVIRKPIQHGTPEGFRRHAEFGQSPCLKCALAVNEQRYGNTPSPTPEPTPFQTDANAEHGTIGGYQRHKKRRTKPCDACKAANAAYSRWRRGTGPRPPWVEVEARMGEDGINHGTPGGYQKHRKRGEKACDDCLAGLAAYRRQYRDGNAK